MIYGRRAPVGGGGRRTPRRAWTPTAARWGAGPTRRPGGCRCPVFYHVFVCLLIISMCVCVYLLCWSWFLCVCSVVSVLRAAHLRLEQKPGKKGDVRTKADADIFVSWLCMHGQGCNSCALSWEGRRLGQGPSCNEAEKCVWHTFHDLGPDPLSHSELCLLNLGMLLVALVFMCLIHKCCLASWLSCMHKESQRHCIEGLAES